MKLNKKYIFLLIIVLAVSFLTYCFFPVISYEEKNSPKAIILYDRNGIKITDKSNKFGYKIKFEKGEFEKIKDSNFVKSLIRIEDKNFYNHWGVNILSKLRAIKDNISGKRISGASTITEQFIKNKYFLGEKRTYLQKIREMIISFYFTLYYSKKEVLEKYLNSVYLGNNLYGLKSALKIYFDKSDINELNNEEISILLSLLNRPGTKNIKEESFVKYQDKVKQRLGFSMSTEGFNSLNNFESLDEFPFVTKNNYPILEFLPLILREGGYKMKNMVSIDSKLQQYTKDVIKQTLEELKGKNVTNAAVFAIIPESGEILIYQGSRDFNSKEIDGQVDVIKSLRQPGSTVKPFLYLLGLDKEIEPDDLILDIQSEYNSFVKNTTYISENYSLKQYGLVRFKKALGNSFNNATVRLAREIGLSEVYDFYKSYGFNLKYSFEHYGYSLVLGNPSISLKDLVFSYAKLLDLKDKNKFLLYNILSDSDNRDISFGVNSILNTSIPQAVKTGTSSDFRDNLVISYHPDLILGVWVGNNDNSSMKGVTGITGAGYIWHQIIEKAISLGYIKNREIEIPDGIVEDYYCLDLECFSKELIYKKKNKQYFSRINDSYYSKKDLGEKLSDYEKDKLNDLGFEIRE